VSFSVEIPVPPSVNVAFRNVPGKGRVQTREYRAWHQHAALVIKTKVPQASRVGGPFYIAINLPHHTPGDIDNRIKGIVDALVKCNRVDDDRNMEELHVRRRHIGEYALIHVKPLRCTGAAA